MGRNEQEKFWTGKFGREYNARNLMTLEEIENLYMKFYDIKCSELNHEFLDGLHIDSILECGCGVGNQLLVLKHEGWRNLFGIDIQKDAIEAAKKRLPDATFAEASLSKIPFKDNNFDLVYTSGLLIHVNPDNLLPGMNNIVRVSRKYILGAEYYDDSMVGMEYHGRKSKLWKANYCRLYLDNFPLKLIKREKLRHSTDKNGLVLEMFIMEKTP